MTRARPILTEQSLYRTRPDVSPDGKRIVYSSTAGAADQFNHLYVLPVEGGQPYKLTFGDFDDFHPRWSPDGEWIAYITNEAGLPELYVLEVNGGGKRKIEIAQRQWKRPMGKLARHRRGRRTGKPWRLALPARLPTANSTRRRIPMCSTRAWPLGSSESSPPAGTTGEAPPGKLVIEATKGFEYGRPERRWI